jgi:hypothetical protein
VPQPTSLADRPTALYRFFDADGRLLYVGITFAIRQRWYAHAQEKTWWPQVAHKQVEWLPNRYRAAKAEIAAIKAERPLYNVQDNDAEHTTPPPATCEPAPAYPEETLISLRKAVRTRDDKERRAAKMRAQLADVIAESLREGMRPGEVAAMTGYSREHIRRIARKHEVEPLREATVTAIRKQTPES